jgi:thiol-disulfide isomerase/thioredoxin
MNHAIKSSLCEVLVAALFVVAIFTALVTKTTDGLPADFDLSGRSIPIEAVKADRVIVVGASWCAPCQRLKPSIATLRDEGYNVRYVDVTDWKGPEVSAVPTTYYYRGETPLPSLTKTGLWTIKEFKQRVIKPL